MVFLAPVLDDGSNLAFVLSLVFLRCSPWESHASYFYKIMVLPPLTCALPWLHAGPVDWAQVYADCNKPLVIDIGCGSGRFLLLLASKARQEGTDSCNYLGLDIHPAVSAAGIPSTLNNDNRRSQKFDSNDDLTFVCVGVRLCSKMCW